VVFALLANAGIAVAKAAAWAATGSGAMLAESIHSLADSGNQALLLLGFARAKKEADARHPLGYGREAYFWAFVVAVILFTLGGLFSLYEGSHKLAHPEPIVSPGWAIGVLLLGCLLEGGSLWAAWRVCKRVRGERSFLKWSRTTGDVNLLVVTWEDLAAMAGLLIALAAVLLTTFTGNPFFDAVGTLVLGALLLFVAVFLAIQVRRLIVGFSAPAPLIEDITELWEAQGFDVLRMIAVWVGPSRLMIACKVRPREMAADAAALVEQINATEKAAREAFPDIAFQFVEPDTAD
jgi:cation diffusion facilitator family transporter